MDPSPTKGRAHPQNLFPIGALERELRRRLGDPAILYRVISSGGGDDALTRRPARGQDDFPSGDRRANLPP